MASVAGGAVVVRHGLPTDSRWSWDGIKPTVAADDTLYFLLGALLVLSMHGGFAFLEAGSVSKKNETNSLVKILVDLAVSTISYFMCGYAIAYGGDGMFTENASTMSLYNGIVLMRFFFLLMFATAIPGIISGGIAERATFWGQTLGTALMVGVAYPVFEGLTWGKRWGLQPWFLETFGAEYHDFAGSVVVHAVGGWAAAGAIFVLRPRFGRDITDGARIYEPSPINSHTHIAQGSWALIVGWFGFNVMSSQSMSAVSGLVAVNSLMALAGGILSSLIWSRNDPAAIHNGALSGLVGVCAGSDIMHPFMSLVVGLICGFIFVKASPTAKLWWRLDDVLGVFPLHGLCGTFGGIIAGVFGLTQFAGIGGVNFWVQVIGTLIGCAWALACGIILYGLVHFTIGFRMGRDEEIRGCDVTYHSLGNVKVDQSYAAQD